MGFKPIPAVVALVLTLLIWFVIPILQDISPDAQHPSASFVGIIAGIIDEAMPTGAMVILGITLVALTGVTNEKAADAAKNVLNSLDNSFIWMIGITIIISRGLLRTGSGMCIGCLLIFFFDKRTLGVGYSLALADLVIGPIASSNIVCGSAIAHPIMESIALSFDSDPEKGTEGKIGKYLSLVSFHSSVITCLIFITTTAPNPLVVELVTRTTNAQIQFSWGTWFLIMVVPGLIVILLMPLMLYFLYPPKTKQAPSAIALAKERLAAIEPMRHEEKIMPDIFSVLPLLWTGIPETLFGVKVDATATAFLGLSPCLLTGILTWDDALKEKGTWDTIVWFAALVMMANFLNKLGLISWLSDSMQSSIAHMGLGWETGCVLSMLAYLYTHYVFASGTTHVAVMFGVFHGTGLALDAPSMLSAPIMAAATGIVMSLTHYVTGFAPIIYGSNYVNITERWKAGFIMSVIEILIFSTVDILWWKTLGYW